MTYYELIQDAEYKLNFNMITLGEYEEMIKPLKREIDQQTCKDCISREAVLKHLENITMDTNPDHYGSKDKWYQANGFNMCKVGIEMYVKNLPSVTPQPKVGKWIDVDSLDGALWHECSECGETEFYATDYCPNCGAKMVESEDKE